MHFLNNVVPTGSEGAAQESSSVPGPAAARGTHALALPVLTCYNLASRGLLGKVVAAQHFL